MEGDGMTNLELIRELGKPGKVYMPVATAHDVVHLAVEKTYLIDLLKQQPPADEAWWTFYGGQTSPADRWLDVNT
jgi:hypothetical protein